MMDDIMPSWEMQRLLLQLQHQVDDLRKEVEALKGRRLPNPKRKRNRQQYDPETRKEIYRKAAEHARASKKVGEGRGKVRSK
jgi:hypothetical protein